MPRVHRLVLVVVCAAVLVLVGSWKAGVDAVGQAQSQSGSQATQSSIDALVLKALQWRSIGPARGGRSIAASGVKGRPKEAYFGAVGGGLWKTTDGGENWAAVTDGQIGSASVGAVAVSETSPDTIYIGMGESCIRASSVDFSHISGGFCMPRVQRLVLVVVCAAVLVLVGSWKAGVDAVGQAQSQSGSQATQSSIDALVLKALQWRSIGPARGGRRSRRAA